MRPFPDAAIVRLLSLALVLLAISPNMESANGAEYQTPPQVLVDIIDAPPTPNVSIDPTSQWMLLMQQPNLPSIAELAQRELRLAGMRINPQISGPSRTRPYSDLTLLRMSDLEERSIRGLPQGARIEHIRWSPDGSSISFTNTVERGIELWVIEVESGRAKRLTTAALSLTARIPPKWLPDGKALMCTLIPKERGDEPAMPQVPEGPITQENIGKKAPARTYQDLLKNEYDADLFQHYMTSQLALVSVRGKITRLGKPGILWDADPSPNGEFLLVETIQRPFSYLVPAYRFPLLVEVWDKNGKLVRQLADLPLQEEVPIAYGSVPTGPRSYSWRGDAPATLSWVEALDGGDAAAEAEFRDQVYTLAAPFSGAPEKLARLSLRYSNIYWGNDDVALVYSWWWKTRTVRAWRVMPGSPRTRPDLLFDYSWQDRYNDPGDPRTRINAMGRRVLLTDEDGSTIFLVGNGGSSEGDRPFIDAMDVRTKTTTRLFRSEAPYYERPIRLLDATGRYLLTRRESIEEPPNFFVRDLESDELRQVTFFEHPTPQLLGLQKEIIKYKRNDGLDLTAKLYLPAGYKPEDGPLPMVMWAYPREFKSASDAGQMKDSPYRFARVGWWSPLLWLTQGYAVLDDASLPIVGEGEEEPNDTFREQLVNGAKAAVDEVVRRGVAEPGRIAVGGHSYGAFMTANLLAHSDLFAAGIARSGAYNRSLTPFGFQSEERTLWDAPEIYFNMSPFMHAEKVNEPILLIHGEADNNSGTFPMQSERYYNALKGHGATTRLVMLPHESHGYRARESILHMMWETHRWLETYVLSAEPQLEEASSRE